MTSSSSWRDIADVIRSRVAAGTYPPGVLIPSTTALGGEFGVSQGPVQRAVALLRAEGLVVGEQGRGVRVVAVPAGGSGSLADRVAALEARMDAHERGHGGTDTADSL